MFKGEIKILEERDLSSVEGILGLYWEGELKDKFFKRIKDFTDRTPESIEQLYRVFVAEENGEVVGVGVLRKASEFMKKFTTTDNPAEFYVLAVKYKQRGIGEALREARIIEAKKLGFTEVVLYGAESHKDIWAFHDASDFKRLTEANAPNGEPGMVWRLVLN